MCIRDSLEAVSRLISLALRSGIKPKEIVNELRGISDLPVWDNGKLILSAPDAVAQVLAKHSSLDSIEKIGIDITQSDSNNTTSDQNNGNGINTHSESKDTITDQPKVGMPCPECHGSNLIFEEGCLNCHECGYSKCG